MMARLSPFFPAMVVFLGAVAVALGSIWASWRQSNFNMELREKNEQIARLQYENASMITGGDSFALVEGFQMSGADGSVLNAHSVPDRLLLIPTIVNHGRYPLYDVGVRFGDLSQPITVTGSIPQTYSAGNIAPGLMSGLDIRLQHFGKNIIDFNIFFAARNGIWVQFLRMRWVGDGWATANKVKRGPQEIYREVSDNFPRREDGSIDWGEPEAQDTVPEVHPSGPVRR
jgi:hypothetical protein